MIGYLVNAIVPLRAGDAVRAYVLGRRHGIAVSTTLSTVAVVRIVGIAAIVATGFILSTMLDLPPLVLIGLRTFLFVSLFGLTLLFALSFWRLSAERLDFSLAQIRCKSLSLDWRPLGPGGLFLRCAYRSTRLAHPPRRLGPTLLGWSLLAASLTMFISSFRLDVPYLAGALMMVAISLGAAIPSAPGSTGVYHMLTVLALSVWNVPAATSVAVGQLAHFVTIALHIVVGLLCAWWLGIRVASLTRMNVSSPVQAIPRRA